MDRHRVVLTRSRNRTQRRPAAVRAEGASAAVWQVVDRHAALAARTSLALVYLWFGLLKVFGDSPVTRLVSATLPFGDPRVVVGVLGGVEVALGIWLLVGRAPRLLAVCLVAHLGGTFLTFLMAPGLTMRHDNPVLLTADGEFVVKNLVLISTALLVVAVTVRAPRPAAPSAARITSLRTTEPARWR